jgi:hypothetical protein
MSYRYNITNDMLPPDSPYRDRGVFQRLQEEMDDLPWDSIAKTAFFASVLFFPPLALEASIAYVFELSILQIVGSGALTLSIGALGLNGWSYTRSSILPKDHKDEMQSLEKIILVIVALAVDIFLFSGLFFSMTLPLALGCLISQGFLAIALFVYPDLFFGLR